MFSSFLANETNPFVIKHVKGMSDFRLPAFLPFFIEILLLNANSIDLDQMPHFVEPDLGPHSAKAPFKGMILKTVTCHTSPNVSNGMVNLIVNILKIQNFHSSCSKRHS